VVEIVAAAAIVAARVIRGQTPAQIQVLMIVTVIILIVILEAIITTT